MKIHKWPVGSGECPDVPIPQSSRSCPIHDGGCDSLFILHTLAICQFSLSRGLSVLPPLTFQQTRNYTEKVFRWFLFLSVSHMLVFEVSGLV